MTTNPTTVFYGGQSQTYWEEIATSQPATFLEFAHHSLLGHEEEWIKTAYENAAFADPVKAFRFSDNFAARPWAKNLLLMLATDVPDCAVSDFMSYAYPRGNSSAPQNIDPVAIHERVQASHKPPGEWCRDKSTPKLERIKQNRMTTLIRKDQPSATDLHNEGVAILNSQIDDASKANKMRPWAMEVFLKALMNKPSLAMTNEKTLLAAVSSNPHAVWESEAMWTNSSIAPYINAAIVRAEPGQSGAQSIAM